MARPDLCRGPCLQLLPFRSCLPGNDGFFPLSSNWNFSAAGPCWKPSSAACSLVQECRTLPSPSSTSVMGGGMTVVRWGWRWGGGFALVWESLWCRMNRGHLRGWWPKDVLCDKSLGSFCLTQLVLEWDRSYSRCRGTKVTKGSSEEQSCSLFTAAAPGTLQAAPGPQSSMLSSRSSSWQAAPALGPRGGWWCCSSPLVGGACGPISIAPGPWSFVSGRECHWAAGRCELGCRQCPEQCCSSQLDTVVTCW